MRIDQILQYCLGVTSGLGLGRMQRSSCPAYTYITTLHSVQDRTKLSLVCTLTWHLPLTVGLGMVQIFFLSGCLSHRVLHISGARKTGRMYSIRPGSGVRMKTVPCGHPVTSRQDVEPLRSPASILHRKQLAASIPHACLGHHRCRRACAQAQETSPVGLAGRLRGYSRAERAKAGSGK